MILGSARIVADWSPPPSCINTIDPGRTWERTVAAIFAGLAGLGSRADRRSTARVPSPPLGRCGSPCDRSSTRSPEQANVDVEPMPQERGRSFDLGLDAVGREFLERVRYGCDHEWSPIVIPARTTDCTMSGYRWTR